MDKLLVLFGGEIADWKPILIAIAALAAALMSVGVCLWRGEKLLPMLAALPLGTLASVCLARLIHWYCRSESYASLQSAFSEMRGGGYSLIGVFAGMLLAFGLVRLLRLTRDLPALLDCAVPGAALGIAIGRMGDLFTTADRGKMILADEALHHLPYAAAVQNATSGATEWRFATFAFQSIWCAALCLVFLIAALWPRRRAMAPSRRGSGSLFALFMALYCCGQIVLDSTRYDALFLRSNGFVSLEQILCAVVLAAVAAVYSVRSVRLHGLRFWHWLLWVLALAGLGLAGYMEYYVQRHGSAYLFAYGLMCLGLALFMAVILALFATSAQRRGGPDAPPDANTEITT